MGQLRDILDILFTQPEGPIVETVDITVDGNIRQAGAVVEAKGFKLRKHGQGQFGGRERISLSPPTVDVRIVAKGVPGVEITSTIEINSTKKEEKEVLRFEIEQFQYVYPTSDFGL